MVNISISPDEDAILILRLIVQKLTNKKIPIDIFHSIAIFTIILELPLIEPQKAIFVQKHPVSMIEIIASLSKIQSVATFEENQFVIFLKVVFGYLLYLLVRVLEQTLLGIVLVFEDEIEEMLLLGQELLVEIYLGVYSLLLNCCLLHYNYYEGSKIIKLTSTLSFYYFLKIVCSNVGNKDICRFNIKLMKKLLIFLLAATLTISTYKLHPTPLQ